MHKLIKASLFVCALSLAALFVMKLLVEHRVNQTLDDVVARFSLFGDFSYHDVDVNLWGSRINISDIAISTHSTEVPTVRAKRWSIELADNLLFKQVLGIDRDKVPDTAALTIEGLQLPVDTHAVNDSIDQLNQKFLEFAEPGCGDIELLGFRELAKIGYHYPYTTNFTLSYEFDRPLEQVLIKAQSRIPDMATIDAELTIRDIPGSLILLPQAKNAYLSQLDITYHDLGYIERVNEYCAKQENLSQAEYIQQQVEQPDANFAFTWGTVPDNTVRNLYGEFLQSPESIHWRVSPRQGFNPKHLSLYEMSAWPKILRLEIFANGTAIDLNGFSKPSEKTGLFAELGNSYAPPVKEVSTVETQPITRPQSQESYHLTPMDQLVNYIGRPVRIKEHRGKIRLGLLKSCDDKKIHVAQRVHGGEYSVSIKLTDIATAEIHR